MRYILAMILCASFGTLMAAEKPIVIVGATVHDGSGGPGRVADVCIVGDKITAVGKVERPADAVVIDGMG